MTHRAPIVLPTLIACILSAPAGAQTVSQPLPAPVVIATATPLTLPGASGTPTSAPAAAPAALALPADTEVKLTIDQELSSKKAKVGDTFALRVAEPVMLGSAVVIPAGTPATGAVTLRAGKGALGKSAKMEVDLRSLTLNGRDVPLTGHDRVAGASGAAAAVGVALLFGPLAAGVSGGNAVYKKGRVFIAHTAEPIPAGAVQ